MICAVWEGRGELRLTCMREREAERSEKRRESYLIGQQWSAQAVFLLETDLSPSFFLRWYERQLQCLIPRAGLSCPHLRKKSLASAIHILLCARRISFAAPLNTKIRTFDITFKVNLIWKGWLSGRNTPKMIRPLNHPKERASLSLPYAPNIKIPFH